VLMQVLSTRPAERRICLQYPCLMLSFTVLSSTLVFSISALAML
jgi:hypothetical protein